MSITYHVGEHDEAWAYRLGDVWSEAFPTHELALARQRKPQSGNSLAVRMRRLPFSVRMARGQQSV